jgi:2'-5' RNA ligase
MACLRAQARRVRAPAFRLRVDRQGFFDRARVAWLGCSEPPSALFDLQRQLGTHLQECAFQPEARVYNPHITVARKLRSISTEARFAALEWPVDAFALVESQALENGVQYRVVESWPLE